MFKSISNVFYIAVPQKSFSCTFLYTANPIISLHLVDLLQLFCHYVTVFA